MIGPRAAPSSPRSPFPNIHRRVIKAFLTRPGPVALRYWSFKSAARQQATKEKPLARALVFPFEALFMKPQSLSVTSLQAFLISVLAFFIFSRGL